MHRHIGIFSTLRVGSHGSQVIISKSHEVNPCILYCWEHRSWDLPLHTGSQVLSPKYDMDVYMTTLFGGKAWDLCCEVGRVKKLDPILNPRLVNIFPSNDKDPTFIIFNHVLVITWGSQVGTLPPCWDLLTWVGLGTPCRLALNIVLVT